MDKHAFTDIPPNRIAQLRREQGLSQYDVERLTGISQSRLSLLERSYRPLSARDLDVLAQAFGVAAAELFNVSPTSRDPTARRRRNPLRAKE